MTDPKEEEQEEQEEEELVSSDDELLFTAKSGPRVICLRNPQRTQLLTIVKEETEDSFLLLFPSMFVTDSEGAVDMAFYVKWSPIVRILKSDVGVVTPLVNPLLQVYEAFLSKVLPSAYPGHSFEPEEETLPSRVLH
jgi:hypothetical protein